MMKKATITVLDMFLEININPKQSQRDTTSLLDSNNALDEIAKAMCCGETPTN